MAFFLTFYVCGSSLFGLQSPQEADAEVGQEDQERAGGREHG